VTQVQAGTLLGLTPRHIRRLIKRVAPAGDQGLRIGDGGSPRTGRSRSRASPRRCRYPRSRRGTLAAEQLVERQGMVVNAETLRGWLLAKGGHTSSGGSARTGRGGSEELM
jgi:hypothetical protein